MIVSIIHTAIGAFFNAIMDSVENEHINDTIFWPYNDDVNKDRKVWGLSVNKFWYKRRTASIAMRFFKWKLDGWHVSKTLAGIELIFAIVSYRERFGMWIDGAILLALWIIIFKFFYNTFFKRIS